MLEDLKPHIAELRDRLIKCVIVLGVAFFACFAVWEPIMAWVTMPLKEAIPNSGQVVAVKMGEQFFTAVSVSFFASLVISLPVIFYQIWAFLAPGLYEHEKRYILPFVIGATGMFIAGALFAYYFVFPVGFKFLVNFGGGQTTAMISIAEYLSFFLKLMFGFGISFELPVIAALLAFFGLVDDKQMKSSFRYAIVIIFVVAAILTPPDVMSQLMMATPMIILYGVAILLVKMINPAPKEENEPA
ncbi:MAG: twin-arginine translocase subunit TatC [Campylobacteraceae bacterium]|jgi:sec-independent protein translocase protein TatC|nr:twin-arginine translocase subunit TatC [Campylobacteraceae bacterium]